MPLTLQTLNIPSRRRSARWRWTFALALAIVVGATACVLLTWQSGDVVRAHWRAEIARTPDDELPALLVHLAETDERGLPLLVEMLDDDRPVIASAAERALRVQINHWRTLSPDEASRHVATLAHALAEASTTFRSSGRYAAAQLADEILDWPYGETAVNVNEVLADCETILRASGRGPDELMTVANESTAQHDLTQPGDLPIALHNRQPPANSPLPLANPLPGGGLPIDAANVARLPPVIADVYEADNQSDTSPPAANAPPPLIYEPLAIPLHLADDAKIGRLKPREPDRLAEANTPSSIANTERIPLTEITDVELMRRLHDTAQQDAAAEVLRDRGFDALRLEIARRLTHPDAQVRQSLANDLPQVAGVDARPWLEELAADSDASVRRVAIAIIASGGGTDVDDWLVRLRQGESDPRVAELINNALKQRR